MNDSSNAPLMSEPIPSGPAGWIKVWIKAVTKPSEQTFVEISESPDAKMQTAFIWSAVAGLVAGFFIGIGAAIGLMLQTDVGNNPSAMGMVAGFICGYPIGAAIGGPIGLAISAGITQWVAKMFGGTGSFEKLIYPYAAILAPITLVSGLLSTFSAIPFIGACIGIFSFALSIYSLVLNVIAVKAVNKLDTAKAAASVLIPALVLGLCVCVVVVAVTMMGVGAMGMNGFGGQFAP